MTCFVARRPVVVATHHRVEDLQDGGGALHPGIVRTATLVAGVREQRRDALQVTEVDELRVPVHDVLDGAAGIGRAGSRHDRDVTVRSFPSPREQRGTDADRRVPRLPPQRELQRSRAVAGLLPRPPGAHAAGAHRVARAGRRRVRAPACRVGRVDPARRAGLRRRGRRPARVADAEAHRRARRDGQHTRVLPARVHGRRRRRGVRAAARRGRALLRRAARRRPRGHALDPCAHRPRPRRNDDRARRPAHGDEPLLVPRDQLQRPRPVGRVLRDGARVPAARTHEPRHAERCRARHGRRDRVRDGVPRRPAPRRRVRARPRAVDDARVDRSAVAGGEPARTVPARVHDRRHRPRPRRARRAGRALLVAARRPRHGPGHARPPGTPLRRPRRHRPRAHRVTLRYGCVPHPRERGEGRTLVWLTCVPRPRIRGSRDATRGGVSPWRP